jgi:hypothetical protein
MHRATPLNVAFRSYTAGGARSVVHSVDDSKLMQEMSGNFMKSEARSKIEAPQNYGFTSVVMDADKDGQGNVTGGAETFIQFVGGSRSFPVAPVMDDRRHRLKGLDKGDVAMFRTKGDQLQFHLASSGGYWTGPDSKKLRMQLVKAYQQQQSGASPSLHAAATAATGGASSGAQQKGQDAQYLAGTMEWPRPFAGGGWGSGEVGAALARKSSADASPYEARRKLHFGLEN